MAARAHVRAAAATSVSASSGESASRIACMSARTQLNAATRPAPKIGEDKGDGGDGRGGGGRGSGGGGGGGGGAGGGCGLGCDGGSALHTTLRKDQIEV